MTQPALYHYTCDHGRRAIGDRGTLISGEMQVDRPVPWPAQFVWLTDLATPLRDALGLTSHILKCDRTQHRYRVIDAPDAFAWHVAARGLPRAMRDELELAPGARPAHWWVSQEPVAVEYAPLAEAVSA